MYAYQRFQYHSYPAPCCRYSGELNVATVSLPSLSLYQVLKLDRELLILQLFDSLQNRVMDQRFQRLELAVGAHEAEKWTPQACGKLQEHRLLARTNTVIIRSETQGLVHQLNDNVNAVDLEAKTCSCLVFQENGKPCGHTITTIFAIPGRDLTLYMPEEFQIDTQKKTYTSNFPLIDVSDLSRAPFVTAKTKRQLEDTTNV